MRLHRSTTPRQCVNCGVSFFPLYSSLSMGRGYFCSRECGYADRRKRPGIPVEERFWSRVKKTESCWLWTGACTLQGTGMVGLGQDATGKQIKKRANRLSWEIHHGPIPEGRQVCHNCPGGDNPACVNPNHLFLGTHQDNMDDMHAKGRSVVGERHYNALFKDAEVIEMRRRYAAGGITYPQLAQEKGVKTSTIRDVIIRKTYKHLP